MGIEIAGQLLYEPQERQALLHETWARQIFYGGAAGGGKSTSIRWDGIAFCLTNPGCQAFLFRRTRDELERNHIVWVKRELGPFTPDLGTYSETRNAFEFRNGSTLYFCYCERDADVTRYQGAEMHWCGIDEAGQNTEFVLNYLKTRNRLGSFVAKEGRLPRFVMGSNPGGAGHNYLKLSFIDAAPAGELFYDKSMSYKSDDPGWLSIFIPAKMQDNKYIDENYEASFSGLPPELARALRDGDWDAVVGQALHTLSRDRHQLRQFVPPRHWTRFCSLDWGTAAPFSVGWYCVSDGAVLRGRDGWPDRWLPAGAVIRYAEWYGWNGKANQGCRLSPQEVARGIIERETERDELLDYRIADNEMWAQKAGPAAMDYFEEVDPRLIFRKCSKDRKRNYQNCLAYLAGNPRFREDGVAEEDPMFFCTSNCTHFWRTVPTLILDETDPDKGPGDKRSDENHTYDEWAYALWSRPYITTEEDRYFEEHEEDIRRARGQVEDPYATA